MNEINVINIFNYEELNNLSVRQEIRNLLLISSLLSLILGTLVGLAQTRIKRLLAYIT
jgi:NADH:ubiquinone oxidoreductase subunit 2 (subunit N)